MCGIAGILTSSLRPEVARAAASRMQDALIHRGPDDGGLWQSENGSATFAHRRLSILDLSGAARQPMTTPDGRFTICFNGEIYNFRELRAGLEKNGALFQTTSDTEVILRLYERDGLQCKNVLRGMYAFAIWDAQERLCALARDPFGIKPLYLHEGSGTLAFASELGALVQSQLFSPSLSHDGLVRYLESGSVPEPLSLIREVRCLAAGESLIWQNGNIERRQSRLTKFTSTQSFAGDAEAVTREALIDSVRHHFVSDVPVGIFLSGGLDSTALLALSKVTGQTGVKTFSVAVDDAEADESPVARRTAEHFGSEHHEMRLNAARAQQLFDAFLQHLDQPSIDGLNTFTVSSLAREHGMKVVLSGLGGDELFGGYSSFQKVPRMLAIHRLTAAIPSVSILAANALEGLGGKPQHRRMAEFLRGPCTVERAFSSLRGVFSQAEAASLASWITGEAIPVQTRSQPMENENIADEVSRLEICHYMRNQLLRDSDVMSMAHGLELRVPLVDRVLFDAVAAIPASIRLGKGKKLLMQAVPELPDWVVNQKKRGFLFPYQKWLSGTWSTRLDAASAGAPVPVVTWYQKWSLFVLRHCMTRLGLDP